MLKLLVVFAAAIFLAYISEQNTKATIAAGQRYVARKDWAYVLLVTVLTLFTGLRTSYNDTQNYVRLFNESEGLVAFLADPKNLNLLGNPLYYIFQNAIKDLTGNAYIVIFLTSLFAQCCFVGFIKRYCPRFTFGVFLYFTLGTFLLTMAAIKQITAMAILTLSIPYLEQKKWPQYFLVVFIAMLMHTYAMAFVLLPLFTRRPWKVFTFAFVLLVGFLLTNFRDMITTFLERADEAGKTIADYEVFDDNTVNIFRIAVYAVPPVISFVFQKWLFRNGDGTKNMMVHMSIISLAFMTMGTQSGANLFGRMANYFEIATICILPWMLEQTFDKRSCRLVSTIAVVGFFGYFVYANAISTNFGSVYQSMSLFRFVALLFS